MAAETERIAREKKLAEERKLEVEYLSEDEYDALPEEEKATYDAKVCDVQWCWSFILWTLIHKNASHS